MKIVSLPSSPVGFNSGNLVGNELKQENENVSVNSNRKSKSKTKKILLGLGALATISLGGLLYLKRGKVPTIKPPVDDLSSGKAVEKAGSVMTDEARRIYDDFNSRYNDVVDSEWIDNKFFGTNKELDDLNDYYSEIEHRQRIGERIKSRVDRKLHEPQELDTKLNETIDERLGSRTMPESTRSEMQEFYSQMEQEAQIVAEKQAKKEAMLKLKEENPQKYARIKAEQRQLKKAEKAKLKAQELEKNTTKITREDGVTLKKVTQTDKNGNQIISLYSDETGKLVSETRIEPSIYRDGVKSTTSIYDGRRRLTRIVDGHTEITKIYVKGKNGKFKLLERNICNDYSQESKLVRRMANGNFEIIEENSSTKIRIIRDKKGNILSKEIFSKGSGSTPPPAEPPKVLAAWYKMYLDLCKEFGVSPRACGKYGAWDHFYELSLRKNDPLAYEHYLSNREYRARMGYNERAVVMEALDNNRITSNFIENFKARFPKLDFGEVVLQINESLKESGKSSSLVMDYLSEFLRALENGKIDISILENLDAANLEKSMGDLIVKEIIRIEKAAEEAACASRRVQQPQVIRLNA